MRASRHRAIADTSHLQAPHPELIPIPRFQRRSRSDDEYECGELTTARPDDDDNEWGEWCGFRPFYDEGPQLTLEDEHRAVFFEAVD